MAFQKDFVWGAATAAYQIEGAAAEDGRKPSVWDMYCRRPGATYLGQTGEVACDHYHRMASDVALMRELGLTGYRFSLSWSRILPDGVGAINPKGMDFYDRLVDCLLENGITPFITLYHWDLPLELYFQGGWMNADAPRWFAKYAAVVTERLSDRVRHFITFNEPQCFIGAGFLHGTQAPGLTLSLVETIRMSHLVMLAHGRAVAAMRAHAKQPIQIGYAPTGGNFYPATNTPEDIEAARARTFRVVDDPLWWADSISWWSDPVMLARYPDDGLAHFESYMPVGWEKDLDDICQPLDFYGENIYNARAVSAKEGPLEREAGHPTTAMGWPITPECLYWFPRFLYERYQKPIYITENGMANNDIITPDGKVHDGNRIDFMRRYLLELERARMDGVDIAGYFAWSLMDNFEWAHGYSARLGLTYIDYATQQRTIKDSGYWYRDVIASNGAKLHETVS